MRAVDTNVLVRLVVQDDAEQVRSARDFIADGVWASTVTVVETVWVLESNYGFGAQELFAAVSLLLKTGPLLIQDSDAVDAALTLYGKRPALGFADCLILELARKAGHLPLGTFDRTLGKIDGAKKL